MKTLSQVELIESASSWERAYFTTYALSLTFFESYLLPRLRKAGCEHVTVFVDADGYRASLMERRSRSIGQEYALIPIQSSTGIFHPKITYLCGKEGDLLLIGSGNLTFGGHGRNIESLEALKPESDTAAFADFATFLLQLQEHTALTIADQSDLKEMRQRVEAQIEALEIRGATRLLHSLSSPILDQLIEHLGNVEPWKQLIVLSPFHHPEAKPVRKLATQLGVKSLQVGVPPGPKSLSSFPFDISKDWGMKVETVAPRVSKVKRQLHAKWFEIRGRRCFTLVGSVNATEQSLATTRNVEVSVLREIDSKGTDNWRTVKRPAHVPSVLIRSGEHKDSVVHAILTADGSIDGRVLSNKDLAGNWTVWLRIGDQHGPKGQVVLDSAGRFQWRPPEFNEFEAKNSVQVNLARHDEVARGWLSFQTILKLPYRSRSAQAAIARMLAREDSLDDCLVLLDYVAFHSNRLLSQTSQTQRRDARQGTETAADEVFSIADLATHKGQDSNGLMRDLASEALTNNRSWKTLALIARLLSGRRLTGFIGKDNKRTTTSKSSAGDDDSAQQIEDTRTALVAFNEQLSAEFEKAKEKNRNLVPFLVVWLNVNLDMRLRHLGDDSGALPFCNKWIRRAVNAPIPAAVRSELDDSIVGVVATLARQLSSITERDKQFHVDSLSPGIIHQWLESYLGGEVDEAWACGQAERWFQSETPHMLVEGDTAATIDALRSILARPTPRVYLAQIVDCLRTGRRAQIPENVFGETEHKLLTDLAKAPKGAARYNVLSRSTRSCPSCHYVIHKSDLSTLRTRRVARCMHCRNTLLLVEP